MSSSEAADRALVAMQTDHALRQLHEAGESTEAELDNYLAGLRESVERQCQASEARQQAIRDAGAAFLRDFWTTDDEGVDTNVAPGPGVGASIEPATPASSVEPGREQPNPRAAFLAEAEEAQRIRSLSMQDWAEERKRLLRANPGMF